MREVLRLAGRRDIAGMQRVRNAVKENRLTSRVITDEEVADAMLVTGRGWVVEAEGAVRAFAIGNGDTGNVWALFVEPGFEGRGYGRRLQSEMLLWLWSRGLERLWLSTEAGTRAERFYESSGWLRRGPLPGGEVLFERFAANGTRGPSEHGTDLEPARPEPRGRESIVTRRLISSGSPFEQQMAYSRAVVDGEWVFVSGTTGFDYATMSIADSPAEQAEQCFRNIERALHEADAGLQDVVRVRYILPRADDFAECWPVLRRYLADVRPAATMICAGLLDPRMKIEIEVTARRARAD